MNENGANLPASVVGRPKRAIAVECIFMLAGGEILVLLLQNNAWTRNEIKYT